MRKVTQSDYFKIVIGDSLSDFEAAKQADLVLARDHLITRCKELDLPYKPFETFYDCLEVVKKLIEVEQGIPL
ncbi:2-hydroxy-3-keto-5-methylthiopentenyl-1-phosphate phosphatase [compost metagenome]